MPKTAIEMLNDLIVTCEDAREFYVKLSCRTNSRELREILLKVVSTHESTIINLESHIDSLAEGAGQDTDISGRPSTIFKHLLSVIDSTDLVLTEYLEAADNEALERFQKALESEPPEETINLIERQAKILSQTQSHSKFVKDSLQKDRSGTGPLIKKRSQR